MSLQPIYEAKARRVLMEIGKLGQVDKKAAEMRFQELLDLLKLVTNTELLLQMRTLEIHDRKTMKRFLEYLMQRIDCSEYPNEFEEINEQLLRLETLRLIDHNECDMYWQKFVNHPNILKCCFMYFEKVSERKQVEIPSINYFCFLGYVDRMLDIASTRFEHFTAAQGEHRDENIE